MSINERLHRITKACNLWRKCHFAAIRSPSPNLILDAVMAKCAWQETTSRSKQNNEADAFDRHFNLYERPSHEFFRQSHRTHKQTNFNRFELTDCTVMDATQIIHNKHIKCLEALFSSNEKGLEIPPTPSLMTDIINRTRITLADQQILRLDRAISEE